MKWKKLRKRILSIFMAAVILASTAAIAVSAEEPSPSNPVWYSYTVDVTVTDKYGRVISEDYNDSTSNFVYFFFSKDDYEKFADTLDDKYVYATENLEGAGTHYGTVFAGRYTKKPPTLFWAITESGSDTDDWNFSQITGYVSPKECSEEDGMLYEKYADTIYPNHLFQKYLQTTYGMNIQNTHIEIV